MNILVTGGSGFIGSALVKYLVQETEHNVMNLDKNTYAGDEISNFSINNCPNYTFKKIDICDKNAVSKAINSFKPDRIIHLAAESHVDNSISSPAKFIESNIIGTYTLLIEALSYYENLSILKKESFKFHHVSTDEVYGDLNFEDEPFTEDSRYDPSSPYSASKASSDHLVRSWYRTYGLPIVVSNCSNNYGPFQFPEKLIPLTIHNAVNGKHIPIYGNGQQVRDWIYVQDHIEALYVVALRGEIGETYNIGGNCEKSNLELVRLICSKLDKLLPINSRKFKKHESLIRFVEDRKGHDKRYAINTNRIVKNLKWQPRFSFDDGIEQTIEWYLDNSSWCEIMAAKKNAKN